MVRRVLAACGLTVLIGASGAATIELPSGWRLSPPHGAMAQTGTMPQGLALSPRGDRIAVVESGFNPPALRIVSASRLQTEATIALPGAFGRPVWRDERHVLVAGGAVNAVLDVDVSGGAISRFPADGWPDAVASHAGTIAAPGDLANMVSMISGGAAARSSQTGAHPGDAAFSSDGKLLFVSNRGEATVTVISAATGQSRTVPVDLHPSALLLEPGGRRLYVACADADVVDIVDTHTLAVMQRIPVGLPRGPGASPNALALDGSTLYVTLGAENAVAKIRDGRVIARAPAGWYPTGVAARNGVVYITNGKGEGSRANPDFDPRTSRSVGYVASTLVGSIRAIDASAIGAATTAQVLADIPARAAVPPDTIVRTHGPIEHVLYVIKENRTYDQVLGDLPGANGDPKLTWFGDNVTPNQHALARRYGIFDDTDADAQVSANGHNWSTAAFANDYLERFWPPNYGDRRSVYDFEDGAVASTPKNGYLWDAARKAGVSLRDYGEFVSPALDGPYASHMPGLRGAVDPRYPGFDLEVSDETRVDEWQREFDGFVKAQTLPALEIIRLPNDHTSGTRPGALTPQAFVAQNDHALGRIVDRVSHSPYWAKTVVIALEDDAQNGPDHVDDQRMTIYVASPYAAPGVHHAHYTTSSIVRTIELFLGLSPMSIYDAVAPPLYDAFASNPDLRPFDAIAPRVDATATNSRTAYGAGASALMDFSRADAADPSALNDILAHAAQRANQP